MRNIEMNFNKDEFKLLTRMVYSGYFIMDTEGNTENKKMEALVDRILQVAKTFELFEDLDYDKEDDKYYFSGEQEDKILTEYNENLEDSFWYNLVTRLSQRDIINEIGEEKYLKLSTKDKIEKEFKLEEKYNKEFEEHGLDRLYLKKS